MALYVPAVSKVPEAMGEMGQSGGHWRANGTKVNEEVEHTQETL